MYYTIYTVTVVNGLAYIVKKIFFLRYKKKKICKL